MKKLKKPIYRVAAFFQAKRLFVWFDPLPALSRSIIRFVKANGGAMADRRKYRGCTNYTFLIPTAAKAKRLAKIMTGIVEIA